MSTSAQSPSKQLSDPSSPNPYSPPRNITNQEIDSTAIITDATPVSFFFLHQASRKRERSVKEQNQLML
jgi:hypothetical protein